jgi:hypothetical protein
MRFSGMAAIAALAAAQFVCGAAFAQTTLYKAACADSSFKDGDLSADLTNVPGEPITCIGVTVSELVNNHLIVQFVIPGQSVLGFGGDGLDEKANPNFLTLPLKRLYLPGKAASDPPLQVGGIEGFCFLDGKNVRALKGAVCVAKLESGNRRQVYTVQSHMQGAGQTIPLNGASPPKH